MDHPTTPIDIASAEYPERLKHIADPPKKLYCRGNLELLNSECFAVVGTRMITNYGREAVHHFVPGLARQFTIVSGLALGVDAAVHRATLDVHGKTISVLGGPVEKPAPLSNLRLANDILDGGGLIISEYPAGTRIFASNFAVRDRIISGLSRGVLIIEADEKSGSLITAKSAAEQNRDVFVVPGSIFSPKSTGANKLIQNGAKLVTAVADVIEDYAGLDLKPAVSTTDPVQAAILAILDSNGPLNADAIIERSQTAAAKIIAALSMMEVTGLVRQMAGGLYRKL